MGGGGVRVSVFLDDDLGPRPLIWRRNRPLTGNAPLTVEKRALRCCLAVRLIGERVGDDERNETGTGTADEVGAGWEETEKRRNELRRNETWRPRQYKRLPARFDMQWDGNGVQRTKGM